MNTSLAASPSTYFRAFVYLEEKKSHNQKVHQQNQITLLYKSSIQELEEGAEGRRRDVRELNRQRKRRANLEERCEVVGSGS